MSGAFSVRAATSYLLERRRVVLRLRVPVERVRVVFLLRVAVFLRVPVERARVLLFLRADVLFFRVPLLFFRVPLLFLRDDVLRLRVPPVERPRLDVERARLVPLVRLREEEELDVRPGDESPESDSEDPSSSSPLPRNFFATPTAAGTATPKAAPATTFCVVDMPSPSSPPFSSFIVSSFSATLSSRVRDWKRALYYRSQSPRNAEG